MENSILIGINLKIIWVAMEDKMKMKVVVICILVKCAPCFGSYSYEPMTCNDYNLCEL